jgi:hypothetical protein
MLNSAKGWCKGLILKSYALIFIFLSLTDINFRVRQNILLWDESCNFFVVK